MICKEFENRVLKKDDYTLQNHLMQCKSCARMHDIDAGLEKTIRQAFEQEDMPDGLMDQVDIAVDLADRVRKN